MLLLLLEMILTIIDLNCQILMYLFTYILTICEYFNVRIRLCEQIQTNTLFLQGVFFVLISLLLLLFLFFFFFTFVAVQV